MAVDRRLMANPPFIGRPLPRLEDARLVSGGGRYTDDIHMPDETFAAFVRSPHAHARVVRIDVVAASKVEGVLAVLTGADYAADGHGPIPHGAQPTDAVDPRQPAFRYAGGQRPFEQPQPPFALDRVRYIGEPLAVVIAESAALAHDAAQLVEVEYEVLAAAADVGEALAPGAPLVWDSVAGNLALDGEHGDRLATDAALGAADVVVEHQFRNQRIANAQLEPRSAIGCYDAEQQLSTMIAGNQGVTRQHTALAAALRMTPEQLRVIC